MKEKYIYLITKRGGRTFWTKIGVAYSNPDGSLNCKLERSVNPEDGEIHIRNSVPRTLTKTPP